MPHSAAHDDASLSLTSRADRGGYVIAELRGDLGIASAPALREQLLSLLRAASHLIIDLSAVEHADADAQPSSDVMTAVRRRHRRWLRRSSAAATAVVAVVAVIGATVFAGVRQPAPAHRPAARSAKPPASKPGQPVFPGGGRLLLADAGRLRWLYPDGTTTWIPGTFDGAALSAGELLAWRSTPFGASYYTMSLNGSGSGWSWPPGTTASCR